MSKKELSNYVFGFVKHLGIVEVGRYDVVALFCGKLSVVDTSTGREWNDNETPWDVLMYIKTMLNSNKYTTH